MIVGKFCALVACATLTITPGVPKGWPSNVYANGTVNLMGRPIGVYVDNEVPNQCEVVAESLQITPFVIAGQWGGLWPQVNRCKGAINAVEWYPIWGIDSWEPTPCGADAYILQYAFPSDHHPTARQRKMELRSTMRCHPRLVIWY